MAAMRNALRERLGSDDDWGRQKAPGGIEAD